MALTNGEKERRRNDPRVKYITKRICRYNSGKPYVFISYKSDEWEKVLGEIVYKLVKNFGLNVYFDGDFNGHNPHWTEQFPENMEADDCRGVIAFVDDAYTTSYATLMELLYSQAGCQQNTPPYDSIAKPVVTINLGTLTVIYDKSDTGLGTQSYEDGEANVHWKDEKDLFDELFRKAAKFEIINNTIKPYKKAKEKLNKELCSAMFKEVLAYIGVNDNYIGAGVTLEDIVHTIESAFGEDVFESSDPVIINGKNTEKKTNEGYGDGRETNDKGDSSKISTGEDNTLVPETIKIISDGSIFHIKGKDSSYDAFYRKDGDKYTVLAGSKLRYHEKWTPKKIWEQYKGKITNEGILLCDIDNLPISTAAKLIEGTSTSGKELNSNGSQMAEGESYEVSYDSSKTVADTGIIINPEKGDPEFLDGYKYTIFGKPFSAGNREQYKLIYDAFRELTSRHPDCAENLTQRKSVAKSNEVKDPGTDRADPTYFRLYDEFEVNGQKYLVGSSLSLKDKIREIKGMFDICDEDVSAFILNGEPLEGARKFSKKVNSNFNTGTINGYEYNLWNVPHIAHNLREIIKTVFILIAEKYPNRAVDIAGSEKITSVARKKDIDEQIIQGSVASQFSHYPKEECSANGELYYVNGGYNQNGAVKQIEKMLALCGEDFSVFALTSTPEKSSQSGGKGSKKGLSENDIEYIVNNGKRD